MDWWMDNGRLKTDGWVDRYMEYEWELDGQIYG